MAGVWQEMLQSKISAEKKGGSILEGLLLPGATVLNFDMVIDRVIHHTCGHI